MVWWILRILAHFFPLILKQSFLWLIFLQLTVKICQFSLLVEIFLAVSHLTGKLIETLLQL